MHPMLRHIGLGIPKEGVPLETGIVMYPDMITAVTADGVGLPARALYDCGKFCFSEYGTFMFPNPDFKPERKGRKKKKEKDAEGEDEYAEPPEIEELGARPIKALPPSGASRRAPYFMLHKDGTASGLFFNDDGEVVDLYLDTIVGLHGSRKSTLVALLVLGVARAAYIAYREPIPAANDVDMVALLKAVNAAERSAVDSLKARLIAGGGGARKGGLSGPALQEISDYWMAMSAALKRHAAIINPPLQDLMAYLDLVADVRSNAIRVFNLGGDGRATVHAAAAAACGITPANQEGFTYVKCVITARDSSPRGATLVVRSQTMFAAVAELQGFAEGEAPLDHDAAPTTPIPPQLDPLIPDSLAASGAAWKASAGARGNVNLDLNDDES